MNVAGSDNKAEAAVVPGAVVLSVLRCSTELVTSECWWFCGFRLWFAPVKNSQQ